MKTAKAAVLGLVCIMGAGILGGCGIGPGLGKKDIFTIDGEHCSMAEAKVLLVNYQNQYADLYGVDLWKEESGQKEDLESYVKDLTLTELADIYTMDLIGQEKKIELSDTEKEHAGQAAEEYFGSLSEKEKAYMEISQKEMEELYERYALAQKVYTALTEEVDQEVSDDEARVMKVRQIFTTSEDTARKVKARLDKGGDFNALAEEFSETAKTAVNLDRSMIPEKDREKVFALKENEISDVVQTEKGCYIFLCVESYNPELTQANKEKVLEERISKAVDDSYNAYVKSARSKVNQKLWDETKLDTSGDLSTSSFFEVFDQYCGKDYTRGESEDSSGQ